MRQIDEFRGSTVQKTDHQQDDREDGEEGEKRPRTREVPQRDGRSRDAQAHEPRLVEADEIGRAHV